jgi:hypothetical protein
MVLGKLDGAPPEFVERMKKEGRLQVSDAGATRPWLNPHHNANRALLLAVVEEIARNYPGIDGLHLDYIRLPDALSDYSPATRARFEGDTRKKCRAWPAEVKAGGKRNAEFRKWRTADVTRLVSDIRATLRRANPNAKSRRVYGIAAPDGGTSRNTARLAACRHRRFPDADELHGIDLRIRPPRAHAGFLSRAAGRIIPGIASRPTNRASIPRRSPPDRAAAPGGLPGFMLFDSPAPSATKRSPRSAGHHPPIP